MVVILECLYRESSVSNGLGDRALRGASSPEVFWEGPRNEGGGVYTQTMSNPVSECAGPDKVERRNLPRIKSGFRVEVVMLSGEKAGDAVFAKTVNITKEGLGVEMSHELPVGSQVNLVIDQEGSSSECMGSVVWNSQRGESSFAGIKIIRWSFMEPTLQNLLNGR